MQSVDNSKDYLKVWLGILGCVVVVILLLWILDRWSPYSFVNNR